MRAIIAGGGIGGLSAALCLAKRDFEVEVLEQASEFGEIGAGIQLSPNCTHVLTFLGLREALDECAFRPEGTQFRNWRSGKVISETPLGKSVEAEYGAPYYHIHRGDLLNVLVEAARSNPRITLHTGARVEALKQDQGRAEVETAQQSFIGDVVIGADGIHSVIREELWGVEKPRFTGNVAWRALVPTDKLPEGLVRPVSTAWWGPHKHFVHYYVRRGDFVNCVCVVEKEAWHVESWTEPGDFEELAADFSGWHADIQTLLNNVDRDSLYKWGLFDREPMSAWGQGRATLLGDACHPTLPFMAQGAAMAIEDGAVLANCLAQDGQVRANLQQYEELRRKRTAGIQRGSRRNARMFHLSGLQAWLRNRAVRTASGRMMDGLYGYNPLEVNQVS